MGRYIFFRNVYGSAYVSTSNNRHCDSVKRSTLRAFVYASAYVSTFASLTAWAASSLTAFPACNLRLCGQLRILFAQCHKFVYAPAYVSLSNNRQCLCTCQRMFPCGRITMSVRAAKEVSCGLPQV